LSESLFFETGLGKNEFSMSDVTLILERVEQGDGHAAEELLPLVYDELRRLARRKMAGEAAGQTLQPTALVHEAYVRLVGSGGDRAWNGRTHFFAAAAEAMRNVLVDQARRKQRLKRGGNQQRVEMEELDVAAPDPDEKLLLVHESLEQLAAEDPLKTQIVKLHYFVGLTHAEIATLLGISERTVRRHWEFARVWLYRAIQSGR
jgi:RNA polymerase sigma factor (TIGR02999 family)